MENARRRDRRKRKKERKTASEAKERSAHALPFIVRPTHLFARLGKYELRGRRLLATRQAFDGVVPVFLIIRQHAEDQLSFNDILNSPDVIATGWDQGEE